jgi:hypothetical protein
MDLSQEGFIAGVADATHRDSWHGLRLKDSTDSYQVNWRPAMNDLLTQRSTDFDSLDFLS